MNQNGHGDGELLVAGERSRIEAKVDLRVG